MEKRGWSVTLVSQEPNSSVSSASLFSVHIPYFIFVSHLQMILSVLILINIVALSLIIVKMILILSSSAMPGCMCCKGAAIFSCTNTDLQSTNHCYIKALFSVLGGGLPQFNTSDLFLGRESLSYVPPDI